MGANSKKPTRGADHDLFCKVRGHEALSDDLRGLFTVVEQVTGPNDGRFALAEARQCGDQPLHVALLEIAKDAREDEDLRGSQVDVGGRVRHIRASERDAASQTEVIDDGLATRHEGWIRFNQRRVHILPCVSSSEHANDVATISRADTDKIQGLTRNLCGGRRELCAHGHQSFLEGY
jgi:hypothetical protein